MKTLCVLVFTLFVARAMAQTSSTTVKPTTGSTAASAANTTSGDVSESRTMKLLRDHLQVRYFAEFLGPNVKRLDDKSVDTDSKGNYAAGEDPINTFHQLSLRWRTGKTTRVFVEPRFTTQMGNREALQNAGKESGVVRAEDFRAGVMDVYWTSEDKVWSTTYRLGNRFPTSEASRDANITAQPEGLHILSWTPNKDWNVSLWNQLRYYWYEPQVENERWRLYTGPSVTYTINDTFSIFAMYEHEQNHAAPAGKRNYFHSTNSLQDLYAGVNINITQSLTIYPFIRMAQLKKFNDETMQIGAWVMGAVF